MENNQLTEEGGPGYKIPKSLLHPNRNWFYDALIDGLVLLIAIPTLIGLLIITTFFKGVKEEEEVTGK